MKLSKQEIIDYLNRKDLEKRNEMQINETDANWQNLHNKMGEALIKYVSDIFDEIEKESFDEINQWNTMIEINGKLWYYDDDGEWFESTDKAVFRKYEHLAKEYNDPEGNEKDRIVEYALFIDAMPATKFHYEPLIEVFNKINDGIYRLVRKGDNDYTAYGKSLLQKKSKKPVE